MTTLAIMHSFARVITDNNDPCIGQLKASGYIMVGTADLFDRKMAEMITAIYPYLKTRRHHKVSPPSSNWLQVRSKYRAIKVAAFLSDP